MIVLDCNNIVEITVTSKPEGAINWLGLCSWKSRHGRVGANVGGLRNIMMNNAISVTLTVIDHHEQHDHHEHQGGCLLSFHFTASACLLFDSNSNKHHQQTPITFSNPRHQTPDPTKTVWLQAAGRTRLV